MLKMYPIEHRRNVTLRCFWVPSHVGTHATLTAVWIETVKNDSPSQDAVLHQEPDSWSCAA